ncbi:HNH endonuclease [Synoicihabitans lomoniglobus]|uniref:HNH endonuclease n=1 Tax=Synoicihabitans lomoniglobus TaxID=2909285 RepID=A0AAF0CNY4_9BACT|nr:HNH endonuclease [Opitutaceae bacterium LMO-M01]WED65075.1 HNH endonuclease [Opitutaceae bacterium LMO-M01]
MNQDITNKPIVLSLNRVWQPIGHRTVRQALVALAGGSAGNPPALGLDIDYPRLPDGSWGFESPSQLRPVSWDEWLALPIRDFDLVVRAPGRTVRVPTVMVSTHYSRMPVHQPKPSREAIFSRDGGVCQYTGERVGKRGGNLDHVVPRHRGGRDSFENLVWSKREINTLKANRLPHEAGLRLMRRPQAPAALPVAATLREARHPDWRHFLAP